MPMIEPQPAHRHLDHAGRKNVRSAFNGARQTGHSFPTSMIHSVAGFVAVG